MNSDLVDVEASVVRQTELALLLEYGGPQTVWVPKSEAEDNGDGTVTMPEWLALEKGLI